MKLATATSHLETSGITERKGFTIDANSSKLFDILQDTLYTDKHLAPVREYLCNALDAHSAIGQTRAFDVYLPNSNAPEWVVRDYGPGLSHEDVMNLFTTYLRSTKDGADDFIGGFGIGSKSGFAYTDQFTVVSYYNGTKTRYAMFKNEFRKPDVAVVDRTDTDEPNGLEVRLPIASNDFNSFTQKTQDVLRFFPEDSYNPFGFTVQPVSYFIREATHAFRKPGGASPPRVIMGNVMYPVPATLWQKHPALIEAYNSGFELTLFANIGDCSLSPSREALSLDRSTETWLNSAITKIFGELKDKIEKDLTAANNFYDYANVATTQAGLMKSVVPAQTKSPFAPFYHDSNSSNRRYNFSTTALEAAGFAVYLSKGEMGGPPKRVRTLYTPSIPCATPVALAPKDKVLGRIAAAQKDLYAAYKAAPNTTRVSYDAGPYVIVADEATLRQYNIKPTFDLSKYTPVFSGATARPSGGYMVFNGQHSKRSRETVFTADGDYVMVEDSAPQAWLHFLKYHIPSQLKPSGCVYPTFVYVPTASRAAFRAQVTKGAVYTLAEYEAVVLGKMRANLPLIAGAQYQASSLPQKNLLGDFLRTPLPQEFYTGVQYASSNVFATLADPAQSPIAAEAAPIIAKAKEYARDKIQPILDKAADLKSKEPKLYALLTTISSAHYPYIRELWEKAKP